MPFNDQAGQGLDLTQEAPVKADLIKPGETQLVQEQATQSASERRDFLINSLGKAMSPSTEFLKDIVVTIHDGENQVGGLGAGEKPADKLPESLDDRVRKHGLELAVVTLGGEVTQVENGEKPVVLKPEDPMIKFDEPAIKISEQPVIKFHEPDNPGTIDFGANDIFGPEKDHGCESDKKVTGTISGLEHVPVEAQGMVAAIKAEARQPHGEPVSSDYDPAKHATVEKYKDGTEVEKNDNGTTTTKFPNGDYVMEIPTKDGVIRTYGNEHSDTSVTYCPDGRVVTELPGPTFVTYYPDTDRTVTEYNNGDMDIENADGSGIYRRPDGSERHYDPSGNWTVVDPNGKVIDKGTFEDLPPPEYLPPSRPGG